MKRMLITAGGLSALAMIAIGCSEERRADPDITAEVKKDLVDESVPGMIEVVTINGIVTLSGTVPNSDAKDDAGDVAEDVNGVQRVINDLRTAAGDEPIRRMPPPAADAPAPHVVDPNAPSAPAPIR
jgi:hypothetical protein